MLKFPSFSSNNIQHSMKRWERNRTASFEELFRTKQNLIKLTSFSVPVSRYVLRVTLKLRSMKFHVVSLVSLSVVQKKSSRVSFSFYLNSYMTGYLASRFFIRFSFIFVESIRQSCHYVRVTVSMLVSINQAPRKYEIEPFVRIMKLFIESFESHLYFGASGDICFCRKLRNLARNCDEIYYARGRCVIVVETIQIQFYNFYAFIFKCPLKSMVSCNCYTFLQKLKHLHKLFFGRF